jgi:hypothetical protein
MGKTLERAIEAAHQLPEAEQEAIGAWLLAEIESERRWMSCSRATPLDPDSTNPTFRKLFAALPAEMREQARAAGSL